ncbi:ribonuclease III [Streptococcus sp. 10F2]
MDRLVRMLENNFQIVFQDTVLLETAFTHTSYANEHRLLNISHNERLEFLGDAVLQLLISEYLYARFPGKPEGELSKLRSMMVREESLAGFSKDCQFDQYIRLGKGEEKNGGRSRDTILGDLFEAFLGALLLDQGVDAVRSFMTVQIIPKIEKGQFERVIDYKTQLQELLQVGGDVQIRYQVLQESGPAHAKEFLVGVFLNEQKLAQGVGRSKKLAEQEAAKRAIAEREAHVLKGN